MLAFKRPSFDLVESKAVLRFQAMGGFWVVHEIMKSFHVNTDRHINHNSISFGKGVTDGILFPSQPYIYAPPEVRPSIAT